ncbi:CYTL1 domain-containing protein [Cheilinus undulatus]|uniref:CYTL1 domain-containing protein n=1 Tax=Cheilinus undulatus TaxID=241271 RepID=UPI001BD6C5AC|nr:CYTL1 domain-containing protein [Cheilinus undulatus]
MALFNHLLLLSCLASLVLSSPFFPPTCYSKVLSMAREITQVVANLKKDYYTGYCMAHMPYLYLDVHNACVIHKIRTYISLIEELRQRRCAYTADMRKLGGTLKQLFVFLSQKCHGDLVFTIDDCAALEY